MDIWNWLYESIETHREKGDDSRLELYWTFREAMDFDEQNPQAAFAALEEGRKRAAALGDGWWTLFFEHWKLQNLLSKQRNYGAARDLAARVALEARKPQYAALPQRVCLQEDLISAFVGIDARGHATLIQEALDYMEKEAAPDVECFLCLLGLQSDFAEERALWNEAHALRMRLLARCEESGNEHHAMQSHLELCGVILNLPYAAEEVLDPANIGESDEVVPVAEGWVSRETFEKRMGEVESHAIRAQELAEKLDAGEYFSEIWMWRAHVGFMRGETEAAQEFFKRAIDRFFANGLLPAENFFAAWRTTYWRYGNFDKALQLVEDEEKWIEGTGQLAREARLARFRCHFKLALGTLEAADFEAARAKIALLGDPSHEQNRLAEVETAWKNQNSASAG